MSIASLTCLLGYLLETSHLCLKCLMPLYLSNPNLFFSNLLISVMGTTFFGVLGPWGSGLFYPLSRVQSPSKSCQMAHERCAEADHFSLSPLPAPSVELLPSLRSPKLCFLPPSVPYGGRLNATRKATLKVSGSLWLATSAQKL